MSDSLKSFGRWLLINGSFMSVALYGLVTQADWAHNVMVALVLLLLVVAVRQTATAFFIGWACRTHPELEGLEELDFDQALRLDTVWWFRPLDIAFDTAMFLILAVAGWYVLAVVYALHIPFNLLTVKEIRRIQSLRWLRIVAALQTPTNTPNN
jgi:hypothetical protein